MNLNSQYLVLFKNPRDKQQITVLARQMYPHNPQYLMNAFENATGKPFGHLVVDLKQETPDQCRLRPNVINECCVPKHLEKSNICVMDQQNQTCCTSNDSGYTMDLGNHSCIYCGVLFDSPINLTKHRKRGCPEHKNESKMPKHDHNEWVQCSRNEVEMDNWCNLFYEEMPDEDESPWSNLINRAYNTCDDEFQETVKQYMEDGLSEKMARIKSSRDLRSEYRRALMKCYKFVVVTMHNLSGNIIHHNILTETNKLIIDGGYEFNKAFEMSIRKHKIEFEDLVEDDESDSSESEEFDSSESGNSSDEFDSSESENSREELDVNESDNSSEELHIDGSIDSSEE